MSRAGVPLFYGSAAAGTAVVEISARDGRPFAAVAAFETTRPLRLLDLVDIPEPPSLFDRGHAARRDSLVFLRDFARTSADRSSTTAASTATTAPRSI